MLLPHATDIVFQGRTSVISEGPIRHLLLDPVQQALFHEVCSKLKIKYKMSFILETTPNLNTVKHFHLSSVILVFCKFDGF